MCDHSAADGFDRRESGLRAERLADESRRAANDSRIPCQQLRTVGAIQPTEVGPGSYRADFRPLVADVPGGQHHLPRRESSCPIRPESGRTLRCLAPFCACRMLMRPDNRRVEQQRLQVGQTNRLK